jgi:hypothetical protein
MKHLFVARHGNYGGDDRIDNYGRQQMGLLGKAIKQILNGSSVYLFSSTAPRALDSSQILAVQLALPQEFEQVPYLWSGSDAPRDSYYYSPSLDKLMGLVAERRDKADGLVMVTHLEVAEDFPSHFLKKEFKQANRIGEISKGQAVHLDLEQRTYKILPR